MLFLGLARVAFRATDQWAAFGFAFAALAVTALVERPRVAALLARRPALRIGLPALALVLVGLLSVANIRSSQATNDSFMPEMTRMRGAGEYLLHAGRPGTVVFSPHWDYFPELFFWDAQHRYVGGIAPILQYAYSPRLYWEITHLGEGDGSFTCGEQRCTPGNLEDGYTVLRRDFHATYLILSQARDRRLVAHARADRRYRVRYEDLNFVVFELGG